MNAFQISRRSVGTTCTAPQDHSPISRHLGARFRPAVYADQPHDEVLQETQQSGGAHDDPKKMHGGDAVMLADEIVAIDVSADDVGLALHAGRQALLPT